MDVVHTTHNGRHLGTDEKYYIHRDTTRGTQINHKNRVSKNKIFCVLVYYDSQKMAQQCSTHFATINASSPQAVLQAWCVRAAVTLNSHLDTIAC